MAFRGTLAHRLMHPSRGVEREYLVRLRGRPGPEVVRALLEGIPLSDGLARFDRILEEPPGKGAHSSFRVVLREGRNREVRRLWEAAGFEVSRLLRIRYGPIELPRDMRPGNARRADDALLWQLKGAAGRASPRAPSSDPGKADA